MARPVPVAPPLPATAEPSLMVVGVDYQSAPLELREKVALSTAETEELLRSCKEHPELGEIYLLSTCNRTEAYLLPREKERAFRRAMELTFRKAPEIETGGHFFVHHDREAARRLMAVAAGLESMVLGEPEILGQVKHAAELAEAVGSSGVVVKRLARASVRAGGRARAETAINAGAISFGYAIVDVARQIFSRLERHSVLILGAGEMAATAARPLLEKGVLRLRFANRDPARARAFLEELPAAEHVPFDQRYAALADSDVLVAATAAGDPVIRPVETEQAMRRRPGTPLLAVDLGVPRNVDPAVGRVENVFLHDLDSLQQLVDRNLARRRAEIPRVQEIVGEELRCFLAWYQGLRAEPMVARLQRQGETIRRRELEAARGRFPPEVHEDLEKLSRALVRKLLHHPSQQLRTSGDADHLARIELARQLFQLGDEGEEER
ncbi:MAG TPA: glutamyl-tRNA reductase [Thermoanaerobaculia bacterium]|nr:glutamyl-tRNA reductase [Thermoanaerobaculia bacterium]